MAPGPRGYFYSPTFDLWVVTRYADIQSDLPDHPRVREHLPIAWDVPA
jgi:hypothetical protein